MLHVHCTLCHIHKSHCLKGKISKVPKPHSYIIHTATVFFGNV